MASWRIKHPGQLADGWAFNGTADSFFGRYPGTLVNTPTWGTFLTGRGCIELDGNTQHVNIGDVTQLNAVSAFSICFWMAQDVINADDTIFWKRLAANDLLNITTEVGTTSMRIYMNSAGVPGNARFNYGLAVQAATWRHVAFVFDGSQATDATRILAYVDGIPQTWIAAAGIPTVTSDMAGVDALIGRDVASFDGRLYDFRIASCAYSRDEIISIIHEAVPV